MDGRPGLVVGGAAVGDAVGVGDVLADINNRGDDGCDRTGELLQGAITVGIAAAGAGLLVRDLDRRDLSDVIAAAPCPPKAAAVPGAGIGA